MERQEPKSLASFTFAEIPPSFDLAEEDDLMESVNKWFAGTSDHIDQQAADTTKYQGQAPSVKTRGLKLCNWGSNKSVKRESC